MKKKSILTKKPWIKRLPNDSTLITRGASQINGSNAFEYTQQRMLDEFYPTSHDIYDRSKYPDIIHVVDEIVLQKDENGIETETMVKKEVVEALPRTAFTFQQMIETKRTDHLTGNDVVFNRNWIGQDDTKDENYQELIDAWEQYDMEDAIYEMVHNANIVADSACVFYTCKNAFGEDVMGWNVYSYLKGDKIYAQQDQKTGDVIIFAREFVDAFDHSLCEVWDSKYYYLFGRSGEEDTKNGDTHFEFDDVYELDGYCLIERTPHGFPVCPVAYKRNEDGPCWCFSQDSIESYEEDFNQMRHNNKVYGEPILVTKGDDVEGVPELDGTIRNINMGKDDDAKYLQSQSASESYMKGLDKLEDLIYIQSFIVKTPELKSGDLPAAALKIIYSPAVEKAMHEVKDWQSTINKIFNVFRLAYSMVVGKTLDFSPSALPIKAFLVPYTHQSESVLVADMAMAVQNGFLSHQTATERLAGYLAEENEYERITSEEKEKQAADLLYEQTTSIIGNDPQNTGEGED